MVIDFLTRGWLLGGPPNSCASKQGWRDHVVLVGHVSSLFFCSSVAMLRLHQRSKVKAQLQDPVARKFVLLVDFDGVGLGSLVPLTIVRDLMVIMQARRESQSPVELFALFFGVICLCFQKPHVVLCIFT